MTRNTELGEIGRMLSLMIEKAASFCGEPPLTLRESAGVYFTPTGHSLLMIDH